MSSPQTWHVLCGIIRNDDTDGKGYPDITQAKDRLLAILGYRLAVAEANPLSSQTAKDNINDAIDAVDGIDGRGGIALAYQSWEPGREIYLVRHDESSTRLPGIGVGDVTVATLHNGRRAAVRITGPGFNLDEVAVALVLGGAVSVPVQNFEHPDE